MALVAKGVKRPTSQFRPVLLPLQPLLLSWGGEAEVRTLKAAQWQGGHVMPTGEALLAGSYLNELLMRLLARDDPHPRLFDHYRRAVQLLASAQGSTPWVLRAFELVLLREIGLLPDLAHEGSTLSAVQADRVYALDAENGLRLARADEAHTLLGEQALLLQAALDEAEPDNRLWAACAACEAALRQPLRHLLHYHSGVQVFKTRQLMLDVQALNRASP
jgi:DNA repair protein RecO (recombination protein O)